MDEQETENENKEEKSERTPNKTITTIIILLLILASIVIVIQVSKSLFNPIESIECEDDVLCCIGNRSIVFVSRTCGACAKQKEILGEENLDKFNIIYSDESSDLFVEYDVMYVPTWIINNETFIGVQTAEQLKNLTDC